MGLTTWKNGPKGAIRKKDVSVAKNYLDKEELDNLNRIVTMYLDYAELQAKKSEVMYMKNWMLKLDAFLQFNEKEILKNAGQISHELAVAISEKAFEKYKLIQLQNYESDFDKELKKINESGINKK